MTMSIQIIGDLILDCYISGQAQRLSPEAPVPVLTNLDTKYVAGGAANVAKNLANLQLHVDLVGVVGHEDDSNYIIESLLDSPYITRRFIANTSAPTITKTRIVADGHQLVRLDNEQSHAGCSKQVVDVALATTHSIAIISDYNKGAVDHSRAFLELKSKECRVLVDPKRSFDNYAGAWLVKPNRREFEQFVGSFSSVGELVTMARVAMAQHNITNMLVTLGADGMVLVTATSHQHLPTTAQEVYDITGAGDVVISVLAYGLAKGYTLEKSVAMANRAAGKAVAHHGNYVVTLEDVADQITVFTNGCFDILHPGHVAYLLSSRALGDRLVVGLNSDASVQRLKGLGRPVNNQEHRKVMLEALGCVDQVVIFDEDTPLELIKDIQPDIITKGGDYEVQDVVGADLARVVIMPTLDGHSTTAIINKVKQ